MMAATLRRGDKRWWCDHRQQRSQGRRSLCAACRGRKPTEPTATRPRRRGRNGGAFAYKPPDGATPVPESARCATPWSAALISLLNADVCSDGLIARPGTTWGGENWQHVSFCCARVLSHDP